MAQFKSELKELVRQFGDKTAISTLGEVVTYGGLIERVEQFALRLDSLTKGSVVAIIAPNGIEYVVAFLAVIYAGLVAAPFNPAYGQEELEFYLEDVAAQALILVENEIAENVADEMGIPVLKFTNGDEVTTCVNIVRESIEMAEGVGLVLHTSGTTSKPKLVPIMVDALQHTIQHLIDAYQLTEKDRILLVMPLFHVHGLIGNLLITLFSGGEAIIPPKFSAHHFLEQADQGQATWFSAVPTIYRILLTKPEYLENEMLSRVRSRLRFIRSCSAALPHDLRITMTSVFKVPILQAYAMTEAAHLVATGLINDNNCPEASVGKPLGCTVVILDDERTCLSDKVGEICVKGYGIMKGYLKPKSANLTAFSKDGLFRTGDLGSIDASGYLHVQGRIKELINRGGEKINPHEIDAVLQASPLVHEAITFPLPDDIYGEIPACVIVLESNVNVQTAKEQLCAHCREHLALFKCPARLIFTESIPKSAIESGMESRPAKKRSIKWSFSPKSKTVSSTRPSPNTTRILAEKENSLLQLASRPPEDGDLSSMLDMWRSPKMKKTDSPSRRSMLSSLAGSPTRHKSIDPMSIVVDIEDLAVGSSFFSETEVLMANEMPVEEKQLIHRFLQMKISNVKREYIGVGPLAGRTQVILSCLQSVTQKPVTILLRDLWIECDYRPGTIVSVLPYSEAGEILIDGSNGAMLAYDPTNLISITTVADAVSCLRKATLSVKMQPASCDNRPTLSLVSGTVAHDVFEQGIRDPRLLEDLTALIRAAISGNLPTIYACGEDEVGVQQAVCEILRGFPIWCSKYLRERPFADAHVIDELRANMPENSRNISIPHVYSLEESITVPGLGLKGKLDAVVMLRYGSSSGWESILVPLELKTGKSTSSTAHRAQTLLYTILLSERYDLPVNFGLLYYVASDVLLRVAATDVELQALMMTRNRLAAACQTETLPKPISNPNACKYCAQIENCMTMMRLNKEEHQVNEVLAEKAKDFAVISDDSFYRHWMQLVDLEQAETLGDGGNKASSIQGAQLYRCGGIGGVGVFGRWLAEFDISPTLMTSSELAEGDPVSIYLERDTVHEVAIGLIQRIDAKSIVVGCDRDVGTILQRSADFCPKSNQRLVHVSSASLRFTIVKSEMLSGFALSRTNIVRLYAKRLTMHRELISGLRAPTFVDDLVVTKSAELDDDQNEAIRHCLAAKEYALLLGMPGTGKTTTIVALIKALVGDNKRVLVSSYTHSAVDNLLTKVSSSGLTVLRFGNADRIDPRLQNRLFSAQNFPSVKAMRDAINSTLVFGTTCLGVNHPALATVNFDYCIVDEASQITVPAALGPILMAPRFILVGDHYQLPPLVKSRQAQSLGLHVSLFKILAERHPYTVAILRKQYRMNEDIQLITNRTVYNGQLECGSLQVRDAVLNIAKSAIDSLFCGVCSDSPNCWIRYVLQPACRVCFLDTDLVPAWETVVGMSFSNVGEAHIIGSIINAALSGGLKEQQLCVISAFRPQIKLLAGQLPAEIEVSTVDRYQGRDKDCVILSFVRSNAEHYIGTLLCDWYRLNVAFTRARHKLLMVGSWSTLMDHEQLYILRDMILEQGWYYQLPPNAHHHDIL